MKKIFFFLSLLISLKGFSQLPQKQTIGTDSTEVNIKGATKTKLINYIFTDTSAANLTRIKQYPAALIFTSSDNKLWLRNSTAVQWILQGGGGAISSFDTTTIYQTINNLTQYIYDTSFTNQFMPAGNALDTTYFVSGTDDSVRAYVYKNGNVVYDTLGRSLITTITNNITQILHVLDSVRSDTTFAVDRLRFYHDPNSRNDTLKLLTFTTDTIGGVPPPLSVTGKFLKDDGTWGTPAAGAGNTNSNIGSGYRLAVPGTNNIKTLFAGTNITLDSAANANGLTINSSGTVVTTLDSTQLYVATNTFAFPSVPATYSDYFLFRNDELLTPLTDFTTSGNNVTILLTLDVSDRIRFRRTK